MVKLMDNTVIHEVYNSVKQAFFTVAGHSSIFTAKTAHYHMWGPL